MHNTMSELFTGHIDNFYVQNGNLRISGWLVSKESRDEVVYFADIGHSVAFYNYNERQDVADFYKSSDVNYLKCGFDISIPAPNKTDIVIYALVRGQKHTIFSFDINRDFAQIVQPTLANETTQIKLAKPVPPSFVVVDNFYENPDEVRQIALQQTFNPDLRYHKGQRTETKFFAEGTKQRFEAILGRKITNWTEYEYNGIFQYCTAEDPLVYHSDIQSYAGAVYLTPDAPVQTGTSFYRSRKYPDVRKVHVSDANYNDVFENNYYDKTRFELVDTVGNVYNRLALWDARLIHSASEYFGTNKTNSRLFHLFFFDIEE